jgi:hypothetical protein
MKIIFSNLVWVVPGVGVGVGLGVGVDVQLAQGVGVTGDGFGVSAVDGVFVPEVP